MGGAGLRGGRGLEGWGRRGMLGPVPRGVVPTGKGGVNARAEQSRRGAGASAGSLGARLGFAPADLGCTRCGGAPGAAAEEKAGRTAKWGRPGRSWS